MKLRDHPLIFNWPPVWTQPKRSEAGKTVTGEVGTLLYAHCNPLISRRCFLVIDYEGDTYVGTLTFDNHPFCKQVADLLGHHLKKSIKEVGDLEIP